MTPATATSLGGLDGPGGLDRLVGLAVEDHRVPTPLLFLDRRVLERNLDDMASAARAAGVALRPHIKSHKLAPVAAMQLARGAIGLTVAKLSEAAAMCGQLAVPSVMLAQPYIGGGRLDVHLSIAAEREVLLCLDDAQLATALGADAAARGTSLDVVLIVDTGYGRLGVTADRAVGLAADLARTRGIRFRGIRSHTGNAYTRDGAGRRAEVAALDASTMSGIAADLADRGIGCPIVSVGSTPGPVGIDPTLFAGVTEWRPGNYAFFDRAQRAFGAATTRQFALTVVSSVISATDRSRARVDAGKKTLTSTLAPGDSRYGEVIGRDDIAVVALSEESGWLDVAGDALHVGDRVRIAPNHACELTNLAEVVAVGTDGVIEEFWTPVARGKVW